MKKFLLSMVVTLPMVASAGWYASNSESYLTGVRNLNGYNFQCQYKTNPGNRGWRYFTVNFQGGCPRLVYFNANNGQVSVPN